MARSFRSFGSSSHTPFSYSSAKRSRSTGAARGLVGVDADEAGDGGARRHPLLGEHALHLPGRRPVALGSRPAPTRTKLAVVVGGDRERLQRLEVDGLGAVGVEELGRGVAEAKPLLDQALGDPEACGDGGDGGAGTGELGERDHLIGRVPWRR